MSIDGDTGFRAGDWRFIWRVPAGSGDPVEAFRVLFAERNDAVVQVREPQSVQRLPGIRFVSPDEALQFVRLFTEPESYFRFVEPHALELPNSSATVAPGTDGTFVITRQLLYPKEIPPFNLELSRDDFMPLYQVRETVSADGTYSCKKLHVVEWVRTRDPRIPRFE